MLLVGCSSGRLKPAGEFDPQGVVIDYLMAGSSCIVANLWDVTDKDIDRLTEHALRRWGLCSSKKAERILNFDRKEDCALIPLTKAVAEGRDCCVLPYLVGAAAVVYGIPAYLDVK